MQRTGSSRRIPLSKKKRRKAGDDPEQSARDYSENRTARDAARIKPEQIYRIAAIGFLMEPRVLPGVLDDAYKRIFDGHNGPCIALHAGYVIGRKPWPTGTEEVCEAAREHGVAVLFEAVIRAKDKAYLAYEPRRGLLPVKLHQQITDSDEAKTNPAVVAQLVEDCGADGKRTINLAGLRLGLLICGENNIFISKQSESVAQIRHQPGAQIFEGVRFVFNGAHYGMGEWGHLDKRFRYLSRGRRWAFHAANCRNETLGKSTVRAYYDGALIAESSMQHVAPPRGVKVQRFLDDGPNDRYLALVFDIPGRLLV
jgi:hypothetical protein